MIANSSASTTAAVSRGCLCLWASVIALGYFVKVTFSPESIFKDLFTMEESIPEIQRQRGLFRRKFGRRDSEQIMPASASPPKHAIFLLMALGIYMMVVGLICLTTAIFATKQGVACVVGPLWCMTVFFLGFYSFVVPSMDVMSTKEILFGQQFYGFLFLLTGWCFGMDFFYPRNRL